LQRRGTGRKRSLRLLQILGSSYNNANSLFRWGNVSIAVELRCAFYVGIDLCGTACRASLAEGINSIEVGLHLTERKRERPLDAHWRIANLLPKSLCYVFGEARLVGRYVLRERRRYAEQIDRKDSWARGMIQ